jgi:hypothetical protein
MAFTRALLKSFEIAVANGSLTVPHKVKGYDAETVFVSLDAVRRFRDVIRNHLGEKNVGSGTARRD